MIGAKEAIQIVHFAVPVDDIMHMLFYCTFVKPFIEWITNIMEDNNIKIEINLKTFILSCLHERQNHIINFISVCIKQYLFRCRCQNIKPNINKFENEILFLQDVEWFNAKHSFTVKKHIKKWGPVFPELFSRLNCSSPSEEMSVV